MRKSNKIFLTAVVIGIFLALVNLFGDRFTFPHIIQRRLWTDIIPSIVILVIIPIYCLFIIYNNRMNNWIKLLLITIPTSLLIGLKQVIWMVGVPYPSSPFTAQKYISTFFLSNTINIILALILTLIPIIVYLILKKWNLIPLLYSIEFVIITLLFTTSKNMFEMFNIGGPNAPGYVLLTGQLIIVSSVIILSIFLPRIERFKAH